MSDIAPVDVAVVGPDPLWVVDNMNRLHNELPGSVVRDFVTILEAIDDLAPGHPAVLLLAPELSGGAGPVVEALMTRRTELSVVGTITPGGVGPGLVEVARASIEATTGNPAPDADDHAAIVAAVTEALRRRGSDDDDAAPRYPPTETDWFLDPDAAQAHAIAEGLGTGSRLVTVTAGKGGVGTTTVAINLAAAFVHEGGRAIIVDAHGATGDVGVMLGLTPPPHDDIEGFAFTRDAVGRMLVTHDSGVDVLALPTNDDHLTSIETVRLLHVLVALDGQADLVVVDAPVQLVLDARLRTYSEHVIVVTSAELASIKDTRVVVSALAEDDAERLVAVLNHPTHRRLRAGASDIAPAIGIPVVADLPFDDHIADIEHPVTVPPARSGYGHAIRDLVGHLKPSRT